MAWTPGQQRWVGAGAVARVEVIGRHDDTLGPVPRAARDENTPPARDGWRRVPLTHSVREDSVLGVALVAQVHGFLQRLANGLGLFAHDVSLRACP
jgi:hypothetical protein